MEGLGGKLQREGTCDLTERAFMPRCAPLGKSVRAIPLRSSLSLTFLQSKAENNAEICQIFKVKRILFRNYYFRRFSSLKSRLTTAHCDILATMNNCDSSAKRALKCSMPPLGKGLTMSAFSGDAGQKYRPLPFFTSNGQL